MVDFFYQTTRLALMALNIKSSSVERLVNEIARITGETKTEAIRRALEERKQRLAVRSTVGSRRDRIDSFFASEVWPQVPRKERGRRLTRKEEDAILGFGSEGV